MAGWSLLVLACGRTASRPPAAPEAPAEAPAAPQPSPVPLTLADVEQVIAAHQQPYTLHWEVQGAGEGVDGRGLTGFRPDGDRFLLLEQGTGFLHRGRQAWYLTGGGTESEGPYNGIIPQRPFINEYEKMTPDEFGMLNVLKGVWRHMYQQDGTRWAADLRKAPGQRQVLGAPRGITGFEVWVKPEGGQLLPERFRIEWGGVRFTGRYEWGEPAFPQVRVPQDAYARELTQAFVEQYPRAGVRSRLEADLNQDGRKELAVLYQTEKGGAGHLGLFTGAALLPLQYVDIPALLSAMEVLDHGAVAHLAVVDQWGTSYRTLRIWGYDGAKVTLLYAADAYGEPVFEQAVVRLHRLSEGVPDQQLTVVRWDAAKQAYAVTREE